MMALLLEMSLHEWLSSRAVGLKQLVNGVRQMAQLLENIQGQATVMAAVRDQFQVFQIRIEDLRLHLDATSQDLLAGKLTGAALERETTELDSQCQDLRNDVQTFIDGLTCRVPFIAQRDGTSHSTLPLVRPTLTSDVLELVSTQRISLDLPFELRCVDDAVRADSNSYVMRLSGELHNLDQKREYHHLAQLAKHLDSALSLTLGHIDDAAQEVATYRGSLSSALEQGGNTNTLQSLSKDFDDRSQHRRSNIARSFSPIRDLLHQIDSATGSQDKVVHDVLIPPRRRAVDNVEAIFDKWNDDVAAFKTQLLDATSLSLMGSEVDASLQDTLETISSLTKKLDSFRAQLSLIKTQGNEIGQLQSLWNDYEAFSGVDRPSITHSFSALRDLLHQMDSLLGSHSPIARDIMVLTRSLAMEKAESMFKTWADGMDSFTTHVLDAKHLAQLAHDVDDSLSSLLSDLDRVVRKTTSFKLSLSMIMEQDDKIESLHSLSNDFEMFSHKNSPMDEGLGQIRDILHQMDASIGDNVFRDTMCLARNRAVDDAQIRFNAWRDSMKTLGDQIFAARQSEAQRLEEQRKMWELAEKERMEPKESVEPREHDHEEADMGTLKSEEQGSVEQSPVEHTVTDEVLYNGYLATEKGEEDTFRSPFPPIISSKIPESPDEGEVETIYS
jgi:hypothetical protein